MFVFSPFFVDKFDQKQNKKHFSALFRSISAMADESDDELPANWQTGKTTDGHVFYINHQTQQTQWEHPITKKVQIISQGLKINEIFFFVERFRLEMPFGWKETTDKNGKNDFHRVRFNSNYVIIVQFVDLVKQHNVRRSVILVSLFQKMPRHKIHRRIFLINQTLYKFFTASIYVIKRRSLPVRTAALVRKTKTKTFCFLIDFSFWS